MAYQPIDMRAYSRREHFEHFLTMVHPFVDMTVQMDVTAWRRRVKANDRPFFLSLLYHIIRAANGVPELRQRIRGEGIVQYDLCGASYTVAAPDGTYRYCNVRADLPYPAFIEHARAAQKRAEQDAHLTEDADPESYFYVSCAPWVAYSALSLPVPDNRFSVPSIVVGKAHDSVRVVETDGLPRVEAAVMIPVTLQVHHALVDGVHMAAFFARLENELQAQEDAV